MATQTKLAVILHADIVGSTTLVRRDERLAHDRVREAFDGLADVVRAFQGTVREIRGDAMVAEFARVSDAVTAALAGQVANAERTAPLSDGIVPEMRIGIALGEVVIADRTVTGAGVVLAQRLEQLAQPGGVCVQGSVYEALPGRLPFDYQSLGEQELKGFDEPVRAFSVVLRPGERLPAPEMSPPTDPAVGRLARLRLAALVAVLLLVAGGLVTWLQPWKRTSEPRDAASDQASSSLSPRKPSIAVLAFTNMSDDPEQDYFAEGIAEDIITDLSKFRGLFVIARNSSFSYKGRNLPIKEIARELGVRYVLEGSVRRAGTALRVNVQLIEAQSESHVWAERYDGVLDDVFEFQDVIARSVVKNTAAELSDEDVLQIAARITSSAEAYDAYLHARRLYDEWKQHDWLQIHSLLRKAVQSDPEFAEAYGLLASTAIRLASSLSDWLAVTLVNHLLRDEMVDPSIALVGLSSAPTEAVNRAVEDLISKSLTLRDNAAGRTAQAEYYRYRVVDLQKAATEFERVLASTPGDVGARIGLASVQRLLNQPDEARRTIREAMRLDPNFPLSYRSELGKIEFVLGNYQAAETALSPVVEVRPFDLSSAWHLAAALALGGETARARRVLENVGEGDYKGWTHPSRVRRQEPYRDAEIAARLLEGLTLAGMRSGFEEVTR